MSYGQQYFQSYPQYSGYQQPIMYQPQQSQIQPQQQPTIQQIGLYGKIVDNYNTADSQDVPIGMNGIYPRADGTAVYIKRWMDNGVTKTSEYRLVEPIQDETQTKPNIDFEEKFEGIYDMIDKLGKKIDKLSTSTPTTIPKKKKVVEEVEEDDE